MILSEIFCISGLVRSNMALPPFDYTDYAIDCGLEWRKWLRSFETMIRASRIEEDEWKKDLLLHYAGAKVQELFDTLPEIPSPKLRGPRPNVTHYTPNMTAYEEAICKLNAFFLPKENVTYERHLLRQMRQKPNETIDMFSIRLRMQGDRCAFGDKFEENIKDQIIENCKSTALRRELLKRGDASLGKILRTAKIFETVSEQEKSFLGEPTPKAQVEDVHQIQTKPWVKQSQLNDTKKLECNRCGYNGHFASDPKCPAKGNSCAKCGGRDHFAKKCRSTKRIRQIDQKDDPKQPIAKKMAMSKEQHDVIGKTENTVKHISSHEYVFNVTTADDGSDILCQIGGVKVRGIIDSGSKYNLLSQTIWEDLKSKGVVVTNQKKETEKVFKAYGGHELPQLGVFTSDIKIKDQTKTSDFYVIKGNGSLLIGLDTAKAMGILQIGRDVCKIDSIKNERLGTIKGIVLDIPIKTDVHPVVQPYRRIPVALEKAVDEKITNLLRQGVIEKVNQPSKWVSPVVAVPKGDDIRICIDMRRANCAVERENHPLPTIEDFLPQLGNATVFSRLDIKNAFHQVQ